MGGLAGRVVLAPTVGGADDENGGSGRPILHVANERAASRPKALKWPLCGLHEGFSKPDQKIVLSTFFAPATRSSISSFVGSRPFA